MFPRVIVSVFLLSIAISVLAKEDVPLDPEATLFEVSFGDDAEKFQKRCKKLHRVLVRSFGNNDFVNVTTFNARMKQFRDEGRLPAQLGHSQFLERADVNKDDTVSREEFCGAMEERMNTVKVKDLANSDLEPETLAVVKKTVCTWKDRLPGFKSQICDMVEDAQEKAEEKEKAETGEEVNIVKRANKKKLVKTGGVVIILMGVGALLTALASLTLGVMSVLIAFPLTLTISILFFILGDGLLKTSRSMW